MGKYRSRSIFVHLDDTMRSRSIEIDLDDTGPSRSISAVLDRSRSIYIDLAPSPLILDIGAVRYPCLYIYILNIFKSPLISGIGAARYHTVFNMSIYVQSVHISAHLAHHGRACKWFAWHVRVCACVRARARAIFEDGQCISDRACRQTAAMHSPVTFCTW